MNLSKTDIRQQKMAVTDPDAVDALLLTARTGFLGLADGDDPYVVPLNFVWIQSTVYFHGAADGRKARLLASPRKATFTVCEDYGTIAHPVPANTDTAYLSAMIFGACHPVSDLNETVSVLQAILDKYVPGYYDAPLPKGHAESYRSSLGSHALVYKLVAERITAKQSPADPDRMFFPGRTRVEDLKRQAANGGANHQM